MKKRILVIGIIMLMTLPSLSAADLYISNANDLKIGNSIAEQSGNIYYVDQNNPQTSDSNPGTEDLPWKTIQKAAETMIAGDTVYVKEGTYNERIIPQNSGTSGNYITYASFPGDSVTIDGTGYRLWYDQGLFHIEKSYIKISGLRVINSEWAGIASVYTDHSIIENCYTYNTYSSGILAAYSSNIIIDDNEVEKANTGPTDEAITVGRVENFEVKNNHVHHCTRKEGIDIKSGCLNGKVYKNNIHDIARIGLYIDAGSYGMHNIDVFQNTVHNCLNGIVLESEGGGNIENINIHNNIIYDNNYNGIDIGGTTGTGGYKRSNIKIINNVLHNNNAVAIRIHTQAKDIVGDFVIRNNILSGDNWKMLYFRYAITYTWPNVYVDHNLFTADSHYYGDNSVIGDPMFVNPSEADFHLLEGSPAIDSGLSIDAPDSDFDGNDRLSGYDIGAFEYSASDEIIVPDEEEPNISDVPDEEPNIPDAPEPTNDEIEEEHPQSNNPPVDIPDDIPSNDEPEYQEDSNEETEIDTSGTWDETNRRAEFQWTKSSRSGTRFEGIESTSFEVTSSNDDPWDNKVEITWKMLTTVFTPDNNMMIMLKDKLNTFKFGLS